MLDALLRDTDIEFLVICVRNHMQDIGLSAFQVGVRVSSSVQLGLPA